MNKSTTDTPLDACPHCGATDDCMCFSEELKRLLKASTASVEFWKAKAYEAEFYEGKHEAERMEKIEIERDEARKELIHNLQTTGGMPWREWSAQCAIETRRADENLERAEKAEAEVERLRSQLERAVEIARGFCGCGCGGDYGLCNFCADQFSELDQLKATMNHDKK